MSGNEDKSRKASDYTQQRNELVVSGVNALILINGGAVVALLAFLQSIWKDEVLLVPFLLKGMIAFCVGLVFSGAVYLLRFFASFASQKDEDAWYKRYKCGYLSCWILALVSFLIGVGFVVSGMWRP